MTDMSKVIVPKSDQLNAEDFLSGPRTFEIERVEIKGGEQPVSVYLVGEARPWKPCKTVCRILVAAWGADASKYPGKRVTLYNDPEVTWAGMKVGGIRVSHLSGIDRDIALALTATRGKKKVSVIRPLLGRTEVQQEATPDKTKPLEEAARQAASNGVEAFRNYWQTLDKEERDALKPILPDLQAIAEDADRFVDGEEA